MNQRISGLYKGVVFKPSDDSGKRTELELRIDVNGMHPLNIISGDFYANSKNVRKYLSSFIFQEVEKIETQTNRILLLGKKGKFSSNSDQFKDIKISISANSHHLKASFQGTTYSKSKVFCSCDYVSNYFRTIYLEHDYEEGVRPLEPYETTDLISPSQHRLHPNNLIDAFAKAGIEIVITKEKRDSVPSPVRTPEDETIWTNANLRNVMIEHFTLFKEEPQWNLWLLSANEYVMSNIYGITIDGNERRRKGCAVFQTSTGWQSAEEKRFRLFIYVHEIGHCFNLSHSWEKPSNDPSAETNKYATLSWMNLPWRYYASEESHGDEAFWKAFNFQFSTSELRHLRHGFRNDVIFGGNTIGRKNDKTSSQEQSQSNSG